MFGNTNPEHAKIVEKIEAMFSASSIGQILSYEEIVAAAGVDVRHRYRHLLVRARENAEKMHGCVFEVVRKVGVKRLQSSEMPEVGLAAIQKCRKAAKRGKKRIDRLNTNSLSEPEQRRKIGYSAMLGAISLIADGRKASAIAAVADPVKPIPPENILEMFKSKN